AFWRESEALRRPGSGPGGQGRCAARAALALGSPPGGLGDGAGRDVAWVGWHVVELEDFEAGGLCGADDLPGVVGAGGVEGAGDGESDPAGHGGELGDHTPV